MLWKKIGMAVAALVLFTSTASAVVPVTCVDYPTVSQLETAWNAAFVTELNATYSGTTTISSTTTYRGGAGQIYVVSHFNVGSHFGSILGVAFDPATDTPIGSGNYEVEADKGFECYRSEGFCNCSAEEITQPDGTRIRRCYCDGGTGGCGMIDLNGSFSGTYEINPSSSYYSALPSM